MKNNESTRVNKSFLFHFLHLIDTSDLDCSGSKITTRRELFAARPKLAVIYYRQLAIMAVLVCAVLLAVYAAPLQEHAVINFKRFYVIAYCMGAAGMVLSVLGMTEGIENPVRKILQHLYFFSANNIYLAGLLAVSLLGDDVYRMFAGHGEFLLSAAIAFAISAVLLLINRHIFRLFCWRVDRRSTREWQEQNRR